MMPTPSSQPSFHSFHLSLAAISRLANSRTNWSARASSYSYSCGKIAFKIPILATRVEAFIYSKGTYAYGGYPDIDELFQQQAVEHDRAKREALLHRIQQLTMERVMYAPIRVAEHAIDALPVHPFPPLEEVRLK
jgi:ABC-type transport system substrate-binding protein